MSYYNGTITNGIALIGTPQNPATIAASGYITNTTTLHSGDAVYGNTAAAWTITNLGRINGTGSASTGVDLLSGGIVTNAAAARIAGAANGVYIRGSAGTVINTGTIQSSGVRSAGIYLSNGGDLTNGASSSSSALITGGIYGVKIRRAGTMVNYGTIEGISADSGTGAFLADGGKFTNASSGVILGDQRGVVMGSQYAPAALVNYGTIASTGTFFLRRASNWRSAAVSPTRKAGSSAATTMASISARCLVGPSPISARSRVPESIVTTVAFISGVISSRLVTVLSLTTRWPPSGVIPSALSSKLLPAR